VPKIEGRIMEAFRKLIESLYNHQAQPILIEFSKFFQCEKIFLKFGVIFLKSSISYNNPQKWEKRHFIVMKVSTIIVIMLSIINFVMSVMPNGSIVVAIESSAAIGFFSLMLLKIYIIMMKDRGSLSDILKKIEGHFPMDVWSQHDFKVGKYLKLLKIFTGTTVVLYVLLWIQVSVMPFYELAYGWMTSSSVKLDVIIKFYIPFDYSNPLVYSIIYIFQSWILIVNIIAFLSIDLLYFGLMLVVSMEFDILKQIMSEIDPQVDQEAAVKKIKALIEIHQELIEITEKLEDKFSFILFVNIFGMIYLICGTAFLSVVSIIARIFLYNYFFNSNL